MNEPTQAGESLSQILKGLLKDAPLSSDNDTMNILDVAGVETIRNVADTTFRSIRQLLNLCAV